MFRKALPGASSRSWKSSGTDRTHVGPKYPIRWNEPINRDRHVVFATVIDEKRLRYGLVLKPPGSSIEGLCCRRVSGACQPPRGRRFS
jgi:hypothetical protein